MLYGQVGTDAASGVILTADALEQIEAVKQNPKLTAQQKINQIAEIVRSAAIAGALTTLSLKGSNADLKQLKSANIEVTPQTLELKTHTDQKKHQVTVKQEVVDVVAEMPKNTANAVVPPHVPLTQKEFDRIINLGKGNRPKDVLEYLPREYVEAHLKRFREEGGAFILIEEWIASPLPDRQAFLKEGKFVGLKSKMDKVIMKYKASGNDWRILRDELNLGADVDLTNHRIAYIKLPTNGEYDYRMPTGNEPGAYDGEWVPGGYTKNGTAEATLVGGDKIVHNSNIDNLLEQFGQNAERLQ